MRCDLPTAHPLQRHGKDTPHNDRRFLIDDDLVFFCGVHLIAVHRLAADELSLPLLIPLDAFDLPGNVLGVHVVHNGPKGRNVIGGGLHAGVDAVQQGDVPHPLFREVPFHIVAGHNVVTAQTAQVLGNDHVDLPGFNVADHPLKIRAIKICAAVTIINIDIINRQAIVLYKFVQQRFLVGHAFGWSFVLILLGESDV